MTDPENNVKSCFILDTQSPFNMREYNIILKKKLNFETKNSYVLNVECEDDKGLKSQSQATIYVEGELTALHSCLVDTSGAVPK